MTEQRWGVTIPLMGVSLAEHRRYLDEIAELGFTDVWSSEAGAHDAFTPLALTAAWTPSLRLGQAVIGHERHSELPGVAHTARLVLDDLVDHLFKLRTAERKCEVFDVVEVKGKLLDWADREGRQVHLRPAEKPGPDTVPEGVHWDLAFQR